MAKRTQVKPMRGGKKSASKSKGKGRKSAGKPKKLSTKLKANEAYCVHPACRKRVMLINPKEITKQTKNRKIKMMHGTDDKGHKVYKIVGN